MRSAFLMVNLVLDPRWQAGHESIYFANFIFLIRRYVISKIAKNDLSMSIFDLHVGLLRDLGNGPKFAKCCSIAINKLEQLRFLIS